jgi:hypothetical protein
MTCLLSACRYRSLLAQWRIISMRPFMLLCAAAAATLRIPGAWFGSKAKTTTSQGPTTSGAFAMIGSTGSRTSSSSCSIRTTTCFSTTWSRRSRTAIVFGRHEDIRIAVCCSYDMYTLYIYIYIYRNLSLAVYAEML